ADLVVFFSSRRRHTRSKRDWSSDVCSSDLALTHMWRADICATADPAALGLAGGRLWATGAAGLPAGAACAARAQLAPGHKPVDQIGRASCRERAESSGVAVSVSNNMRQTEQ